MYGIKARIGLALALLLLAVFAGLYLSGYVTRMLLELEIPLEWNTWWRYFEALDLPQVQPHVWKIKLGGAIGFGLTFLTWLPLAVIVLRPATSDFHGDARFASRADLARAGLLAREPEAGIIIGKAGRRYLWLNGTQHVIVTAPTRSGKSTSIAIPVLLTYEGSVVVLDVKGELHQLTSGYRQSIRQDVYVWSPYDETGRTHRFNPFMMLDPDPRIRVSELQTIAAILYPDEAGKDPFWMNQARSTFVAFASFLFENWDDMVRLGFPGMKDGKFDLSTSMDPNVDVYFPSFERILRLSSGQGGQSIKQTIEHWLADANLKTYAFISEQTRTTLSSLAGLADDTFSSVIATMQAPLQQFISPVLAAATNATDFDVLAVRRRKMSVYVVIPPKKLDESAKLLNIFFSTVIGGNLEGDPQSDRSIRHQVLMLMDEFTSMGRLDVWAKRISVSASYGVRDLTIIQSRPQLRSVYGAEDAQNFITNHGASIVFTPREQEDAEAYSKALGDRTVRRRNRTVSRGSGGGNVSHTYTEERRPLMLPQEIKEFPKDEQLIFYEGCPPIRCKKNWYFKDAFFKQRLMKAMEVPALAAAPGAGATRKEQGAVLGD